MKRSVLTALVVLLLVLTGCQGVSQPAALTVTPVQTPSVEPPAAQPAADRPPASAPPAAQPVQDEPVSTNPTQEPAAVEVFHSAGEPAGCLPWHEQQQMDTPREMLAHADNLLQLAQPLEKRLLSSSWNAAHQRYLRPPDQTLTISAGGLRHDYRLQHILNALHVAGFAAWLRETPEQDLHILAVPLLDPSWRQGDWAEYITAYWQDRHALPSGDAAVIPALKLPPCRWMVEAVFAPLVSWDWWSTDPLGWPDYARYGPAYLATDTESANQVAERIDWLGAGGREAAVTMCGPLVWAQMQDAAVFPPGVGGWSSGPKSFWLSKPSENGRPWSLFSPESYSVYRIDWPLGLFDFGRWPLYPGDFIYTYSKGDGFDHMVMVSEVDETGNIYVITNRVWEQPQQKLAIERVVFASLKDPGVGIAKNEWHTDRLNGRTGHAGFEVFRWAWAEKDMLGEPAAYTVQVGDTLGLVAARWRTPAGVIARYNGLAFDVDLSIGQELIIPPNETAQR
jgi:hypothetical protein